MIRSLKPHMASLCFGAIVLVVSRSDAGRAEDLGAQRQQFTRAYQAFLDNDAARGESLSAGLQEYLLYPYLQYESLRQRLDTAPQNEVRSFLDTYADTYAGEQLRTKWLQLLAKQKRWREFLDDYKPQQDIVLRCAHIAARMAGRAGDDLSTEAKELWLTGDTLPAECDALTDLLVRERVLTKEFVWERVRLAMTKGNLSLAAQLSKRLSDADQRWVTLWREVHSKPAKSLTHAELGQDSPTVREIVRTGVERLARQNAGKGHSEWQRLRKRYEFTAEEKAAIAATIAIAAVHQDRADALQILDEVPSSFASVDLQRAQLLAALQRRNWDRLQRWTEQAPAEGMNALRWRYWRARALEEQGASADARQIFLDLTLERDYYGLLSAERLGVPYTFAHQSLNVDPVAVKAFLEQLGIKRALELRALGFDPTARQEWSFTIKDLDSSGLVTAAAAAHERQWHERAIAMLGKAKQYDDLNVRYPLAFREMIAQYARMRGLEPAVMMSLIRSESAFNQYARSSAGALGLMQMLPATGRLTAKRLGLNGYRTQDLFDAEDNIRLGSAYLRDMLDRFNGNLAMAAAAYNAGPHRVEAWRPQSNCIAADVWVDTIPFTETRRYVRNVLFATALYQMRLKENIKPLRERLAEVTAENHSPSGCKAG